MAKTIEIKCINKRERDNPWERITHVGGINPDGRRWKQTQEETIQEIEAGEWEFYVSVNGNTVWVEVEVSRFGNKYLKTEADTALKNNLLSLPECP
jgi:hypothetical protein